MGLLCAWEVVQSKSTYANAQLRVLHSFLSQIFQAAPSPTAVPTQLSTSATLESCGVTAYGFSGVIAHGILRAVPPKERALSKHATPLVYKHTRFAWRATPHPFVQEKVHHGSDEAIFRSPTAGAFVSAVADHIIMGTIVFPGAGYVLMAEAASRALQKASLVQRTPFLWRQRPSSHVCPPNHSCSRLPCCWQFVPSSSCSHSSSPRTLT